MLSSTMRGRVIKFHTPALPPNTLLLASLEGWEKISQPYSFQLGLISKKADIDFTAVLRKPVSVGIKHGVALAGGTGRGIGATTIHGVLSSLEQGDRGGDWTIYEATLVPRLWRLSLNFHTRVFLEKSVPEIIDLVLKENGLTGDDYAFQTEDRTYKKREYVVQYQESDLDFISRWLEHEGIFYFFRQEEDRERIVFADLPKVFDLKMSKLPDLALPYRPAGQRGEGQGVGQREWYEEDSVHTFRCRRALTAKEVVLQDYNWEKPSIDLKVGALVSEDGHGTQYEFGEHYDDPEEGKALAKIRAEEKKCRSTLFSGVGDGKEFRAGRIFALSEHYREDFNARYLITEVTHRATQAIALTGGAKTTATYENEFVCIPAGAPFRPERTTPRPRIPGTVNAKVDAAGDGKYAALDEHGRYRVRIPFDLSGRGDGKASHAVRMSQPYGGNEYGIHLPLHKGIEVALTHVNGDPDRPVIAGAVPNPETKSPVVDANSTLAVLKSAGNNALVFEDLEGEERVFLHAAKNYELRVKNDAIELAGRDRHLTVKRNQIEHAHNNRHEKIGHDRRVEIGNDRHVTISGNDLCDVGGNVSRTVDGNVAQDYHGDHTESVTGGRLLKADTVVIQATSCISLECGGNAVVIDASGVSVEGKAIILDGGTTKINSGPGASPAPLNAIAPELPALPPAPLEPGESAVAAAATAGGAGDEEEETGSENEAGADKESSWIKIELKNDEGKPVPHEPYRVKLPNGKIRRGRLDKDGRAHVQGIQDGNCEITFPRIEKEAWRKA